MHGLTVTAVIPKAPASAASSADPASDAATSAPDGGFGALLAAHIKNSAALAVAPATDVVSGDPTVVDAKPKDETAATVDPAQSSAVLAEIAPVVVPVQTSAANTVATTPADTDGSAASASQSPTDASAASLAPVPPGRTAARTQVWADSKAAEPAPSTDVKTDVPAAVPAKDKVAEFAASGKVLPSAANTKEETRLAVPTATDGQKQPEAPAGALASVMNAGYVAPTAGAKPATATVEPLVGSSGWGDALGQKVVWMADQKQQVAELHLNPPNLGPVEVRLTVSNDQVSAVFASHQPAVREAIEAAMPRLREMFADSGMMLGNAMVSSDSLPQQQAQTQDGRSSGSSSGMDRTVALDGVGSVPTARGIASLGSGGRGMVDLFA